MTWLYMLTPKIELRPRDHKAFQNQNQDQHDLAIYADTKD